MPLPYDVRRVREDLPAATAAAYFNAGTFGPIPRVAAEAMRAHVDASFERGRIGHAGLARWIGQMEAARGAFARVLDASPDEIALMHCTTDGCNAVVWGLPLAAGDEVVTTTHEHPGLSAPLDELALRRGVTVRAVVPRLDAIAAAIGPRTRLVALSHVLWTNGEVLDLPAIAAETRARSEGRARLLVDGAQSVGAIDVAPGALGADYYTVSGQKWLGGPSGTGALWIRREALGELGTPWPWCLSKSRGEVVCDWTTARRLDASTIGMTSLAGLVPALEWHQARRGEGAYAHAAALAAEARRKLAALPQVEVVAVERPSQLLSFSVRDERASAVARRLEEAGVLVRSIPGFEWVRASVGHWNDEADVTRLVSAVAAVAA
jgi:L-cysteine/cystine lyase